MFTPVWEAIRDKGDVVAALAAAFEAFVDKMLKFLSGELELA